MRKIYLVRHGDADIGFGNKRICLGRKDIPLSHEGEKQAERLARFFKGKKIDGIYTSPLSRCTRTAEILAEKSGHQDLHIHKIEDLQEVDTGIWDGVEFSKIREQYPQEYEERGRCIGRYVIPGGESLEAAGIRFQKALEQILAEKAGDLLIVAHAGVIRAYLCLISGKDIDELMEFNIPNASVTILECRRKDEGENIKVDRAKDMMIRVMGWRPVESISLSEVDRMWAQCQVSPEIRAHMETVADTAMNVIGYDLSLVRADWLETSYSFGDAALNTRSLYYAALLHDIMRAKGGRIHAQEGARYLRKQGYLELADLVESHHDAAVYREGEPLSEAEILYYADKLVKEDQLVTLQQRFEQSKGKCTTPEALEAHRKRYEAALGIEKKVW